jgi:hypothetical protein
MANYEPPTENLPEFNSAVFRTTTEPLTIEEGDARYLRYPLGQGIETIPGLVVGGSSNLDGATFAEGTSPEYRIEYPVNSGRIDFFTNTAGGVLTRGCKIDSTGVHTNSKFDTIDETAGTLDIGNLSGRTGTINIGTGTTAKTIQIGTVNSGSTTVQIGGSSVQLGSANSSITSVTPSSGGTLNLGVNMTSGNMNIGTATTSSTAINIGTGTSYTGVINIGNGANNTNSVNIGRGSMITVDGESGSTPTIFFNRPITPSYTPAFIVSTTLGYTDFPVAGSFGTLSNTVSNIAQFSIGAGVWDVKARVRITSIASVAGNFFRMGFTSSASALGTLYGDWNQDGISGNVNILLSGTFSVNTTTTIYVRGSSASGGGGACDTCDVIATRIA